MSDQPADTLTTTIAKHLRCRRIVRANNVLTYNCGGTAPFQAPDPDAAHVAAAVVLATHNEHIEDVLEAHQWQGGYYCACGHELNSPLGFNRHLYDRLAAVSPTHTNTESDNDD